MGDTRQDRWIIRETLGMQGQGDTRQGRWMIWARLCMQGHRGSTRRSSREHFNSRHGHGVVGGALGKGTG